MKTQLFDLLNKSPLPGMILNVEPQVTFRSDGSYQSPPFQTRLLVVVPAGEGHGETYICEGRIPQTNMAGWVQAACRDAGLDSNQPVCLVFPNDVHR